MTFITLYFLQKRALTHPLLFFDAKDAENEMLHMSHSASSIPVLSTDVGTAIDVFCLRVP